MSAEPGELDELFTVEPANFTATRDALVKRLRAARRKDEAALVARLKRPTAAVWAMNQVARADPGLIDELTRTGSAALAAQERLLDGGSAAAVHAAVEARRVVVGQLLNATLALLSETGASAGQVLASVRTAFEAASVSAGVGDTLRRGMLTALPAFPDDPAPPDRPADATPDRVPARHLHVVRWPGENADGSAVPDRDERDRDERERLERDRLERERVERERLDAQHRIRLDSLRLVAEAAEAAAASAAVETDVVRDRLADAVSAVEDLAPKVSVLTRDVTETRREIESLQRSLAGLTERLAAVEAAAVDARELRDSMERRVAEAIAQAGAADANAAAAREAYEQAASERPATERRGV